MLRTKEADRPDSAKARALNVLVTGGSRGLGLAIAKEFMTRGHRVTVCARSREDLDQAVAVLPDLVAVQADVTRPKDRVRLLATVGQSHALDVLVNNAAISRAHDYTNDFTLDSDRTQGEIETNLVAPIDLSRLFLAQRRGRTSEKFASIAFVNTPGGLFPLDASPLYSTTKAGLRMFALALGRQLTGSGVCVSEIFPPALDTGLTYQLEVAAQSDFGPDAIAAVARESVDGILAGEAVILPYGTRDVFEMFTVTYDQTLLDRINAGVTRRPGWDA